MLSALVAACVTVGVMWPNTAPKRPDVFTRGALPEPAPKSVPIGRKQGDRALNVAAEFIRTAVDRKELSHSYDLVTPTLRQGLTRRQWATGEIPVVPFPVYSAKWELDYSIERALGFKVALFPRKGANVRPAVFNLDLRRVGSGEKSRWLVDGFMPTGTPPPSGAAGQASAVGLPRFDQRLDRGSSRLTAAWLLVPLGLLALIVLVPLAVGMTFWYRSAKATRAYNRERLTQTSSSSPS